MASPLSPTRPYVPKFPTHRNDPIEVDRPRRGVPRWAVIGIFLILLSGFIVEARSFLMPVTLALLLFFVFVPVRRALRRVGIGPSATAGLVTLGMIAAVGVLAYAVSGPISEAIDNKEAISDRLEQRFRDIKAQIRPLEEAAAQIDAVTGAGNGAAATTAVDSTTAAAPDGTAASATVTTATAADGTPEQITVEVNAGAAEAPSTLARLMSLGPTIMGQVLFTLVLLFFMLSSGDMLYLKIVQSFDSTADKRAAYTALRDIEDSIGAYLGAITMVNAGLGVATGLAMWAWGMPSPLLWGVLAFVLNFVPYIGALIGVAFSVLVALLTFDGLFTPIMVGLTFLALTSLEGQFVTPYFVSRKLELNEVVVFLTVALWAFFWSILGMIVAVPMLVVLRVLADHIPGLEKFGNFLAGDAPPVPEEEKAAAIAAGEDVEVDAHEEEAREILSAGEEARTADEAEEAVAAVEGSGDAPARA